MASYEGTSAPRVQCAWDGDPAGYPDFMRRVRLSFERTPRKKRHLLGPEVVAQLTGRAWTITQDLNHRMLVRRNGVIYLLEYLRERLGRTPVPDVGARLENLILRLRRPTGQSMSTWASQLRHHYRQLQVALGRVRRDQTRASALTQEKEPSTPSPARSHQARSTPPSTSSPRRASRETQEEPQGEDDADEEEAETVGPEDDDQDELQRDEDRGDSSWRRGGRARRRRESDSDDSTRALEDLALWDKYDEVLPDVLPSEVLGWLLLRRAGLNHQANLAVQSAAGNSLKLEDVEKSLRSMEDELLAQELRPRHSLGHPKGKGRGRTYWVEEEGEWSMWMGDERDMDDLFETGEVLYVGKRLPQQVHPDAAPVIPDDEWAYYGSWWDPDGWNEWEYDHNQDSVWYDEMTPEQQKEIEEAYALVDQKAWSFVEARQAIKARNLSRGFYPFSPSTKGGSFKGRKGKGKGKGTKGKLPTPSTSSSTPTVLAATALQEEPRQGFLGALGG